MENYNAYTPPSLTNTAVCWRYSVEDRFRTYRKACCARSHILFIGRRYEYSSPITSSSQLTVCLHNEHCSVVSTCMGVKMIQNWSQVSPSNIEEQKTNYKTKASPGRQCNTGRGCKANGCATPLELMSIVTERSIWRSGRLFAFWKISTANLRILWRHLSTELRNI